MQLPPELDFLTPFYIEPSITLRQADWLLSDFDDYFWKYSFGFKKPKGIDWNVQLDDGSRLTDPKNKELLDGFKYFITGSTNSSTQSVPRTGSAATRAGEFNRALHIVDFLLLNAKNFELAKYGLAGLGRDALKLILSEVCSSKFAVEAVYGWQKRLSLYCLNLTLQTSAAHIESTLKKLPQLNNITPDQVENNTLDIPLEIIPRVRAALYLNGVYGHSEKGYNVNSVKISKIIYRDTLKGRHEVKPTIEILTVKEDDHFTRELLPIAVTTGKRETIGETGFYEYRKILYSLGNLHEVGLPAPSVDDLATVKRFMLETGKLGRFRTLPSRVVFGAVRNAIELHVKHGKTLIDGLCKVALHCKLKGISTSELKDRSVRCIIGEDLRKLGVSRLGLSRRVVGTDYARRIKAPVSEYYQDLRANKGLLELVRVYMGSAQIVIGALMGRRVGELQELHASNCLDVSEQWLVFQNRKSTQNLFGVRQVEVRPIEPIAVQMIKNLVRMQKILKRLGYIDELMEIFRAPSIHGGLSLGGAHAYNYNQNLDFFCDYFETETNDDGKRYYIRQHQLRRFFAMLFFYSSGFGGLETLQWMLGHTDVEHVWHYITEAMDGATLAGAKVQYAAEALHSGDIESFESLAALVTARYGTENFTLADTNELEDYLTDLMEEGAITIEPEFFKDDDGQHFKVIAKVTGVDA
ncbi:integrase [Pseudomonas sp.]|uniref:integrase n=1 Tax=Pseudomonas sp. TaxID=306 RepID=UPI0028AAD5E0|nr:integrase [Pseudomonas sp.]